MKAQYNLTTIREKAQRDVLNKNYEEACRKFNILLQINSADANSYFYRGICKYYQEDYTGALLDFTNTIKYNYAFWNAYYFRARVNDLLGHYTEAVSDFNKVLENQLDDPQVTLECAYTKLHAGDFNGCLEDCNKIAPKIALNENLFICRGMAEASLSRFDKAIENYKSALSLNRKSTNALVQIGITESMRQQYDAAIVNFDKALLIDSTNVAAYYNRALAKQQGKDMKGAMNDYLKVIKYEPLNALAYYNLAVLRSQLGDIRGAIRYFDKVLKINPQNLMAVFNRAKMRQYLHDFKGALTDFNTAIELYPHFLEAYYERALLKKAMGNYAGAAQDFNTGKNISVMNRKGNAQNLFRDSLTVQPLLKLNATFEVQNANTLAEAGNLTLQGLIYVGLKDTSKNNFAEYSNLLSPIETSDQRAFCFKLQDQSQGFSTFQHDTSSLKSRQPHNPDSLLFQAVLTLANQQYDKAENSLNSYIMRRPNVAIGYFSRSIAICYADLHYNDNSRLEDSSKNFEELKKRYRAAVEDLNNTITLEPTFAFAYYNRAFVKSKLMDFDGALRDYNMAIQMNPDPGIFHFNKAVILLYLKNYTQACVSLSKAGESGFEPAYPLIKRFCH